MGEVDLGDQQLDVLQVFRKSYKWYKKLIMRPGDAVCPGFSQTL